MRLQVFTSKSEVIGLVFEAIDYDTKTIIQEVSDTSTLFMLEYTCNVKEIHYTVTLCINEKASYCDVIVHELKRTFCGANLASYKVHKEIKRLLLEKGIKFKIVEKESPAE